MENKRIVFGGHQETNQYYWRSQSAKELIDEVTGEVQTIPEKRHLEHQTEITVSLPSDEVLNVGDTLEIHEGRIYDFKVVEIINSEPHPKRLTAATKHHLRVALKKYQYSMVV